MNKKLSHLLEPGLKLYFFCLILFALVTLLLGNIYLAVGEWAIILLLALYTLRTNRRRKREIVKYIDTLTGTVDVATKDSMVNSPLPVLIFRPERDEIIWSNNHFLKLIGEREHIFDSKLSAVVPNFDERWLIEGKTQYPGEVHLGDRRFLVFGHLVRTSDSGNGLLATTYWLDVTEYSLNQDELRSTRAVAAVLFLDNYEDLMKNLNENQRASLVSSLNALLDQWAAPASGILRRLERDRYLFLFQEQYLSKFIEKKFEILEQVHQVVNPSGISATLSIGIGKDAETFQQLMQFANLSVDMALSRGGDQAVIRNRFNFEFYGGRAAESEKRTKVKSRVMANALSSLIQDSSRVLVMGHSFPDLDCCGAAAGVCAIARKLGVSACIIQASGQFPAKDMYDRLAALEQYAGGFLSPQEAMVAADSRTLLVVVDTNRPDQVQAPDLLASCNRVAIIDHHRRSSTYIDNAALNYYETYASSASELVAELAQYIIEPADLTRTEAEALLAGIVLDTKNFTMRTGGRTFEAAAFLRRNGADTAEVKKLFQNDLEHTVAKFSIVQSAELYRDGIAIAVSEQAVGRVTAAQAADELINIIGIGASFVLFPDGDQVFLSARSSLDSVNVQVILEKLGGGGNAAAGGCQVEGTPLKDVVAQLKQAIDSYLDNE